MQMSYNLQQPADMVAMPKGSVSGPGNRDGIPVLRSRQPGLDPRRSTIHFRQSVVIHA